MPQVPLRDTFSGQLQGLGNVEQRVAPDAASFGAGLGQALQSTGQDLAAVAARQRQIEEEDAATQALEALTAASQSIRQLTYGEGGLYTKQQGEALDAYQPTIEAIGKAYGDAGQNLSPLAREAYDSLVRRDRESHLDGAARHIAREREAYRAGVMEAGLLDAIDQAGAAYGDDAAMRSANERGQLAIRAQLAGQPPELIRERLEAFNSKFYGSAIAAAADAGHYGTAKALYAEHKDALEGADKKAAKELVETAGLRERGQSQTDRIVAKTTDPRERLAMARAIKDAELRDEVVRRVSTRNREDAAYAEDAKASAIQTLEGYLEKGTPVSELPLTLIDQVPEKVLSAYEKKIGGGDIETDWGVWSGVMQMTDEELRSLNPLLLRGDLADPEFKALVKMKRDASGQGDAFTGFTSAQSFDALAKQEFQAVYGKIKTTNKAQARYARYRRVIANDLRELEAREGRKATPEEQQGIIDKWMLNVAQTSLLNPLDDDDVRLFEVGPGDKFGVPEADRVLIEKALTDAGIPVTDGTVRRRYLEVQGVVRD